MYLLGANLISLFQQFPRILVLPLLYRIVIDLHGEFIQISKVEYPKPMTVNRDEKEEAQTPSTTCTLSGSRPYTIYTY